MPSPIVSVIIPNHNYGNFIRQAIDSVLSQSIKELELIVVDNGSTDASINILRAYEANPKIRVILQEDKGQANARNVGIDQAAGKHIAFLDADDWWEPYKIEKQLRMLTESTSCVYCGIAIQNESSGQASTTKVELPRFRGNIVAKFYDYPGESIVLAGESTFLITRVCRKKVGFFDESLNSSTGNDFFRRCAEISKVEFVDEPLANYRIHKNNMSRNTIENINDIRRAYYLSLKTLNNDVGANRKILGFFRLKWRLIKTFIKNRLFLKAVTELGKFR